MSDSRRRYGKLKITNELLVEALCLPEGTRIICADDPQSPTTEQCVTLVVEHEDLNPLPPGGEIPTVTPRHRSQPPVVFDGWNQP